MVNSLLRRVHVDFLEGAIAETYGQVDVLLRPVADVVELVMTIPGVGRRVAEVLIAEVGLDVSVFPTAGHLASWAGICPGNNSSGGKRRAGPTRHGSMWLRIALTEAAQAAARTKSTYLAAHHAQIRGRRGTQKAIGATRHDILIAYYHIVRDRVSYQDLGADWNNRHRPAEQQGPPARAPTRTPRHECHHQPGRITSSAPPQPDPITEAPPRRHCRARAWSGDSHLS
jgi:transposase